MNCRIVKHLGIKTLSPDEKHVGDAALITGASSGLGRELAILYSQTGHVILSGRTAHGLEETKKLCKNPARTTIAGGDLTDEKTIRSLATYASMYRIKYLVCCAGVYRRGIFQGTNLDKDTALINANVTATIKLIRWALAPLTAYEGTIIHINSIAGKNIALEEAVYAASKSAMKAFLASFRFEARDLGVRVLDVFPGAIQTPMCKDRPGYDKMMDPREVAEAIYYASTLPAHTLQIEELHLGRFRV
jgi:short-subunit dehydrogenase